MSWDRRIIENAILGVEARQMELINERAKLYQMLEDLGAPKVGRPKSGEKPGSGNYKRTPEMRRKMSEARKRG